MVDVTNSAASNDGRPHVEMVVSGAGPATSGTWII